VRRVLKVWRADLPVQTYAGPVTDGTIVVTTRDIRLGLIQSTANVRIRFGPQVLRFDEIIASHSLVLCLVINLLHLDSFVEAVELVVIAGPRLTRRQIMVRLQRPLILHYLVCIMLFGGESGCGGREIILAALVTLVHLFRGVLVHDLLLNCRRNSLHLRHICDHFQIRTLIVLVSSLVQITNRFLTR
jgi:hypothetical protein